jgi:hypothetical protein
MVRLTQLVPGRRPAAGGGNTGPWRRLAGAGATLVAGAMLATAAPGTGTAAATRPSAPHLGAALAQLVHGPRTAPAHQRATPPCSPAGAFPGYYSNAYTTLGAHRQVIVLTNADLSSLTTQQNTDLAAAVVTGLCGHP